MPIERVDIEATYTGFKKFLGGDYSHVDLRKSPKRLVAYYVPNGKGIESDTFCGPDGKVKAQGAILFYCPNDEMTGEDILYLELSRNKEPVSETFLVAVVRNNGTIEQEELYPTAAEAAKVIGCDAGSLVNWWLATYRNADGEAINLQCYFRHDKKGGLNDSYFPEGKELTGHDPMGEKLGTLVFYRYNKAKDLYENLGFEDVMRLSQWRKKAKK